MINNICEKEATAQNDIEFTFNNGATMRQSKTDFKGNMQ